MVFLRQFCEPSAASLPSSGWSESELHGGDTRLVYAGTHAFQRIASITTVSPDVFAQNWLREVLLLAVLFENICVPCRSVCSGRIAVYPDRPTEPLRGPIRDGNLSIEVLCPRRSRRFRRSPPVLCGPSGISVGRPLSPAPPTKAVLPFVYTSHRSPALSSDRWLAPTKAENPTF